MTYIALVFLAGCMAALQPPINAALGRTVGVLESGLISFAGGTAALALLVLWRGRGSLARVADTPAWQWVGGLLGACMVVSAIVAVPRVGATVTLLGMILGNLVMAALIDHYGWFGLEPLPLDRRRLLGLLLVLAGAALAARR